MSENSKALRPVASAWEWQFSSACKDLPSETFSTQMVNVMIPSPTYGTFNWRVTASGAGPSVTTVATARPRPWLLILAILALVAIVAMLIMRFLVHRRARRELSAQSDTGFDDDRAVEDRVSDLAA